MAQEAVVERMGQIFNIRYKSSSSRFPSFIQQQVKIAKFAYTKDFPNISAIVEIQPQTKSSRSPHPLILDTLEMGTERKPFVGKRLAIPVPENAREGGTFAGRVKTRYKWTNLALSREAIHTRRLKKRKGQMVAETVSERRTYGRTGIYLVHSIKDPNTLYVWQAKGREDPKLIYKIGPPKRMPQMLKFFVTARRAIYNSVNDIFSSLVANGGNDKALLGMFKYGKSSDEIPF